MMTYPEDEIENQLTGELSHDLTIGDSNQFHNHTFIGENLFLYLKIKEFWIANEHYSKQMRRFICV